MELWKFSLLSLVIMLFAWFVYGAVKFRDVKEVLQGMITGTMLWMWIVAIIIGASTFETKSNSIVSEYKNGSNLIIADDIVIVDNTEFLGYNVGDISLADYGDSIKITQYRLYCKLGLYKNMIDIEIPNNSMNIEVINSLLKN